VKAIQEDLKAPAIDENGQAHKASQTVVSPVVGDQATDGQ